MGVVNFDEYLRAATQAGQVVEGNVVRIIADNGDDIGEVVYKVIQGGNGTASEVGIAVQTSAGGALATGLAYLTMTVPTVVAAIAPALGIVAGVGLYELSPEFWDYVSNELVESGKTVFGKCIAYWSGDNSYLDEETIEIVKNALVDFGYFSELSNWDENLPEGWIADAPITRSNRTFYWGSTPHNYLYCGRGNTSYGPGPVIIFNENWTNNVKVTSAIIDENHFEILVTDRAPFRGFSGYVLDPDLNGRIGLGSQNPADDYTYDGKTVYYDHGVFSFSGISDLGTNKDNFIGNDMERKIAQTAWIMQYGDFEDSNLLPIQEDAITPDERPFPAIYHDWQPWIYDPTLDPTTLPEIYPIKYPEVQPNPYPEQEPAQNPDPESPPEVYPVILPDFPIPQPGLPEPEPEPQPDPDPEPQPDPIPEDYPASPDPDPVDPNPNPDPSAPIVVPGLPTTVNSNKLFTVYNPSSSQLDSLGGYLWDSSIIAAIRDIWQEPMDGLISLQQVFVTPATSGSHNIILGFLDSGVSAPVVSNQFVTVDCGSVQVREDKNNATDYAPYTSLHLYLPFIGIVELDTNECMNSTISIKYRVDVYTGTCLAQISIDRDIDMPNDPILYTFSGNCSQQLPLTSGNATGLLSALIGAVTAGVSAASGGGLSTLAGAQLLGNSLTHEMMHVNHSGNISANAGIMGVKKPYLIIGRRHGYDANNYNSFYGFPANKTLSLGNHDGFIRVKKCWIKTSALQEEYEEIMRLLEEGVFL